MRRLDPDTKKRLLPQYYWKDKTKKWRWLKFLISTVVLLAALIWIFLMVADEPLPAGEEGAAAEQLADRMLAAVNKDAWDSTGAVQWTFRGAHQHLWDKRRHLARVKWKEHEVLLDIDARRGWVLDGDQLTEKEKVELCFKAWKYWANDSFWLNPIVKIRDGGTVRKLVNTGDEQALMITYLQGGVTPGDSYLWFLDENGLPYQWKMWVGILPIGGVKTSWEGWITSETGAKLSTRHQNMLTLKIEEVRTGFELGDLTDGIDIFAPLLNGRDLIAY